MSDEQTIAKIEAVLDEIRPNIQMDGGDIEFVNVQDGTVYVRLSGACVGCPASVYTLKMGVETAIKDLVPGINEVVQVHD